MAYVKEKHLWAIFTSELVGSCDQPPNSLHMHSQVGEAAATQDVVGLGVSTHSLQYATIPDNRLDETEACIGCVYAAHNKEKIQEKFELIAQSARCLLPLLDFHCLESLPL